MNFRTVRGTNRKIPSETQSRKGLSLPKSCPCSALVALLLACAAGCEDLRDWKTGPNDVFRGEVTGSDADPTVDSFIRKGFESHTLLELTFDPYSTDALAPVDAGDVLPRTVVAGSVDTYTCPNGQAECAEDERSAGPFVHAPLIAIEALSHDPLSQYTFPGGGRLRNYIFGVHFVSVREKQITGRDAMIFVSLMENQRVEVRAMAPSVQASDQDQERWPALFGVFRLQREAR